ncbi:hypothetical protein C5Y96_23240 [Blastopirellula marina]|uniref:DUF2304 domain-containing protein n=1 Tax=Blastopirellula marina TaxID=124 RepID=A0A2S8F0R3_9BACT|nr:MULTISPECIES: DUF2304 domain-containing protein [Pirellulaceae]PQO25729.1 hypothetical protein C5Y96_23240 [Blastopirellula marina]RCS43412.1 DUF2304 domain-containing protein [Bremerella cremea]
MNLFQWAALTFIGCSLLVEVVRAISSRRLSWTKSFRITIWLGAAICVVTPGIVTRVAQTIGIGRGADVLIYVVTLIFIATTFYFYSRYTRLQRQITDLTRYLAIHEAKHPETSPADCDH